MIEQINAECAYCGKGILVTGDGSRPTGRAGDGERLVFCNQTCAAAWQEEPHCGWCGVTNKTGQLTVHVTEGAERHFCDTGHYLAQQGRKPKLRAIT